MDINLIIISRYSNTEYLNHIQQLLNFIPNPKIIYPNDNTYETSLIIPELVTDKYNLIVYDSSTSLSGTLQDDIEKVLLVNSEVVYLGKYLDTCSNYSVNQDINNFTLVNGTDPVGFNAVLLSGEFTDKLIPYLQSGKYYSIAYAINNYKVENDIVEYATSPNIFVYNPLYNSIDLSKSYNVKTTECQGITSQITPPSDNNLVIFWILLIVIGVCLIFWCLLNFTSFGINIDKFNGVIPNN
jgi:hypothetical protein